MADPVAIGLASIYDTCRTIIPRSTWRQFVGGWVGGREERSHLRKAPNVRTEVDKMRAIVSRPVRIDKLCCYKVALHVKEENILH